VNPTVPRQNAKCVAGCECRRPSFPRRPAPARARHYHTSSERPSIEPLFDALYSKDLTYLSKYLYIDHMQAFAALGDPTRQRIVEMLAARELSSGEIAKRFDMTAPAVSQHLKLLREAGLVQVRRDAQRRIYALDPAGLAELDAWLARFRRFWSGRLDALEHEA
jgi:DNA-binding transcriptional ArsR family regulator